MISIRKQIQDADHFAPRFEALCHAHLSLTAALPKAALPANPELSVECKQSLDQAAQTLTFDASAKQLDEAGKVALEQLDAICRSNTSAIEERDAALKEVVGTVSEVVKGFRGHGERHTGKMEKIAAEFDELSHLEDVNEIRRRLREDVAALKESVREMRRDSEEAVRRFESQITAFQQRLEVARTQSRFDRLTGLGSRRDAEQHLRQISKRPSPICVLLFDIEGFREINRVNGTPFGDKLLQAVAHTLSDYFPGSDTLFRWGADEFLAIAEGRLAVRLEGCRSICSRFSTESRYTVDGGTKRVSAQVASGGTEYRTGDSADDLYRRARESLEKNRGDK
jgi:diguanylate cyclase (GGDEF)-like protein